MILQMESKAPKFATVPVVETENGKSGVIFTKVEEAPAGTTVAIGKEADDKAIKAALAGLLSGAGYNATVGPGDKASVDDVPTKVLQHFRRRV
jgi:hypothetical protein